MRCSRVLLAHLAVLLLLAPASAFAGTLVAPRAPAAPKAVCGALVYSTNPAYPPYDWAVGENEFAGASIDLLTMALPPGVKLQPAVYPWPRALTLAKEGRIDLLVSLRITPERSEFLEFTTHRAFPNPIVVFVRKNQAFPFKSWADLKLKKGGISQGDTFGNGFDEYLRRELTVEVSPTMENNFMKLDAGRIDYFVTSKYVGMAYAATHSSRHGIRTLSPAISQQDIHFGFSKASPCVGLLEEVSLRLKQLDHKGVPEQLLRKHLRRLTAHGGNVSQ